MSAQPGETTSLPMTPRRTTVVAAARSAPAARRTPAASSSPLASAAPVRRPSRLPTLPRRVCWELALVPALLAIGRSWPIVLVLGVSASALLALCAGRARGDWLSTVVTRRAGQLVRRRSHELPVADDSAAALLRLVAPGSGVAGLEVSGSRTGVVSRPYGMVTVLRPVRAGADEVARAAFGGVLLPARDEEGAMLASHLIIHRGPRQDYPRTWITVRATRHVDVLTDEALVLVLANAIRRLLRRARHSDVELCALSDDDLAATIGALAHTGPGRRVLRDEWRYWYVGPIAQVGMRLSGTDVRPAARSVVLARMLAHVPDVAMTITITADGADLAGVVRLAATTPDVVDAAAERLAALASRLGIRLERLDGQHGRSVAATLPIGEDMP
jgi:hypothetical protein